jgi:hypothetical protein
MPGLLRTVGVPPVSGTRAPGIARRLLATCSHFGVKRHTLGDPEPTPAAAQNASMTMLPTMMRLRHRCRTRWEVRLTVASRWTTWDRGPAIIPSHELEVRLLAQQSLKYD